ncbi:MAG TPA: RNA polymerase sigma factor [Chloroflexia bacterium]|nr:RNA polymerase sigma factor [Chloroflexia bacterium]
MTQEQEAITRLKRGDIGGLEWLVECYQVEARQAAYLITGNYALAEDLVQSAFVRAYERIHQFDAGRPFGPWFLRSVINDARMAVTRRVNVSLDSQDETGTLSRDELVSLDPGLYEVFEAMQTREAIWAALDKLSPEQRAAIVMHYYLDLNSVEISQLLLVPSGTVRRRLHDARHKLRRLLPGWIRPPASE